MSGGATIFVASSSGFRRRTSSTRSDVPGRSRAPRSRPASRCSWERRNRGLLLVAAAAAAILVPRSRLPDGRSSDRCATRSTDEKVATQPALTSLPAPGPLLVNSRRGPWIVSFDGSKRRLGAWSEASWSPNAEFVAVTRRREVAAVDPQGEIWWSIARRGRVRGARWSSEVSPRDTRIAYLSRRSLRVVGGNGAGDKEVRRLVAPVAPAWRPGEFELAFSTVDGRIELLDSETAKTVWRTVAGEVPRQLVWSEDGERLLALGERSLRVLDANGRKLWSIGLPVGPSGVVFIREPQPQLRARALLAGHGAERSRSAVGRGESRRGAVPVLRAGRLRVARGLPEREVAPRRLGERRPVALPALGRGEGAGGLEHLPAVRRRDCREADCKGVPGKRELVLSRVALILAVATARARSGNARERLRRADPVARLAVARGSLGRAARPGRRASGRG